MRADALTEPFPDGALDDRGTGGAAGGDGGRPCDLLLQNCAEPTDFCYPVAEEIFILRGDCLCEGRKLGYGDYHRSVEGAVHRPAATDGGCEFILVRHGMPD